jgi:hypothetical protein
MGMDQAIAISIKVISDWRVISITILVLLVFAAMRYVGSVYNKRSPRKGSAPLKAAGPKPSGAAGRAAQHEGPEKG